MERNIHWGKSIRESKSLVKTNIKRKDPEESKYLYLLNPFILKNFKGKP